MKLKYLTHLEHYEVPSNARIGHKARSLREKAKLTAKGMARRMGICETYYRKLEAGEKNWCQEKVDKFNKKLKG